LVFWFPSFAKSSTAHHKSKAALACLKQFEEETPAPEKSTAQVFCDKPLHQRNHIYKIVANAPSIILCHHICTHGACAIGTAAADALFSDLLSVVTYSQPPHPSTD